MKNSLYWYPSPCIKKNYKIGLLGNFGRMYSLFASEACFFSCIASYRVQLIVRPGLTFIQECVRACSCRKWERL